MKDKALKIIYVLVFIVVLIPLFKSVFYTGVNYILDRDEYMHSQIIYFILQGYKPYVNFFNNHSVFFHWVFSPFFLWSGFTFEAVQNTRYLMVFFFFLRVFFTSFLISRIVNPFVGLMFVVLYLNDPLVVFNGMQFRPDGFAILLLIISVIFLSLGEKFRASRFLFSGLFVGLSFITQIKILPTLVLLIFFILISFFKKKISLKDISKFFLGFAIPVLLFFAYFFIRGFFFEMIQQVFFDSVALQKSVNLPVGFLYRPNNAYIFGLMGKPLTWIYLWILPMAASAGAYALYKKISKRPAWDTKFVVISTLIVAAFLQWFSLFFVGGAFSQYYLSFTWMFSALAAFLVYDILTRIKKINKLLFFITAVGIFAILFSLSRVSIAANYSRPLQISQEPFKNDIEARRKFVPENEPVFPGVLFRKPGYPLIVEYFHDLNAYPQSIRKKLPLYVDALKKNKVNYIITTDADLAIYNSIDPRFSKYLADYFKRIEDTSFYIRIK